MSVSLTAHLVERLTPKRARAAVELGHEFAQHPQCRDPRLAHAWACAEEVQIAIGLSGTTRTMLTKPSANHKLNLAVRLSWGLTLYHHLLRTTAVVNGKRLIVNSCPFAGDCTRMCVINNNRGRMDNVKQGWRWRTEMLARFPEEFLLLLSWSIARVVRTHGPILFRPNVNSDLEWEVFAEALVDGSVFGDDVMFYGYTKVPIFKNAGWITPVYRVAYSANETHPIDSPFVRGFLDNGGNVAVVTNRTYNSWTKQPIEQWHDTYTVVNGDKSDEWILDYDGVIGDLAFKPDNLEILAFGQTSDFVHKAYSKELACVTSES